MSPHPHNLHTLAQLPDAAGTSAWGCACGHTGTAPTADEAVEGHRQHVTEATHLVRTLAESMRPKRPGWFANNHEGTTT